MKEVVYDYNEFKAKADLTKPLHHHSIYECKDPRDMCEHAFKVPMH